MNNHNNNLQLLFQKTCLLRSRAINLVFRVNRPWKNDTILELVSSSTGEQGCQQLRNLFNFYMMEVVMEYAAVSDELHL